MSPSGSIRHRPLASENTALLQDDTRSHKYARPEGNYGILLQILRSVIIVAWFLWCCILIVATQILGAPLYFVKKRWFYAYMAMTKQFFGITITALTEWFSPTPVRISGDVSMQGQFSLLKDGRVISKFPDRLVLIANHQVYTDWLYLWWVTYTNNMHGHIYIILKESLKYIPLIGQGMMMYGFIFMARKWVEDKPRLQHRLQRLKKTCAVTPDGLPIFNPMWLLIFPEGTNYTRNTKKRSEDFCTKQGITPPKHVLLPRSTGLFFCLQQLRGTVDYVYDCTVGYEGPPKGSFPDVYFDLRSTYLRGRPPKTVNLYWRRFAVEDIPLSEQKEFEDWIYKRWEEKDQLLEQFNETGRFPPFEPGAPSNRKGPEASTTGNEEYIETKIKLGHWTEFGNLFIVLLPVALALKFLFRLWS